MMPRLFERISLRNRSPQRLTVTSSPQQAQAAAAFAVSTPFSSGDERLATRGCDSTDPPGEAG
jgi:hypothetical protein